MVLKLITIQRMQLSDIIIEKIRHKGPIPFRDFMEMCLYDPDAGYYTSREDKIGANGDYYTSSDLSELSGAMIGKQLEEMWAITGRKEFSIVEYGAGTGRLCNDVLDYLKNNREFYSVLKYYIIEKSPSMRQKEEGLLTGKVTWLESIRELCPVTGCIISNELVDNFSVHKVVMEDELKEVFVDYHNGFVELLKPADKKLVDYFGELGVGLPAGFCTEINLEATEWIKEIATCLEKGYVLTIDYGYLSGELYKQCRSKGTLLCYHQHTINDEPYHNIGKQDITSHVNFSALSHWGSKYGLHTSGYINQAGFFLSLDWEDHLNKVLLKKRDTYLGFREYAFLKYIFLVDMGQKFNVLIQQKGVPSTSLRGLQKKFSTN
ncbi:MAG TPA: SAM-dependent methyltransferase [Chitinophagaceae bacterium]|nr:SAM-dependent methyltransferase [Chitinophagaceae bacterium]